MEGAEGRGGCGDVRSLSGKDGVPGLACVLPAGWCD